MGFLKRQVIVKVTMVHSPTQFITLNDKNLFPGDRLIYGMTTTIREVKRFQRKPVVLDIDVEVLPNTFKPV